MMIIKNKFIDIKCDECDNTLNISPSELEVIEDVLDSDREMGAEYEYDFKGEFLCPKCGNNMRICIRGYEYPVGAYNSQDEETSGCSIVGGSASINIACYL